jgi:hypothetical protein
MPNDKTIEVTRRLKQVAEEQFLRIMEEADRVDPDRTRSTTTAYRRVALSSALDAAIAALNPAAANVSASTKVRDSAPTSYRLLKKRNGELVLQGGFLWHEVGTDNAGFEWRDIRTEVEREATTKLVFIPPDAGVTADGTSTTEPPLDARTSQDAATGDAEPA